MHMHTTQNTPIHSDFHTVSSQCLGNDWAPPSLTAVSSSIKEVARLGLRSQFTFSAPLTQVIPSVLQQEESGPRACKIYLLASLSETEVLCWLFIRGNTISVRAKVI